MKRTLCGVHLAPERPGTMCQEARHKKLQLVSSFQFTNEGAEFLAGGVALGDVISSSLDLYIEAIHKEERKGSNQCCG